MTAQKKQALATISLTPALKARLQQIAAEEDRTLSYVVRRAVEADLARRSKEA